MIYFVCHPSGNKDQVKVIDLEDCVSYEKDDWDVIGPHEFRDRDEAIIHARRLAANQRLDYILFESRYNSQTSEYFGEFDLSRIWGIGAQSEVWYCWKVKVVSDGKARLITPWGDPMKYEFPFDFLYETPERAREGLKTMGAKAHAKEEGWVLTEMTLKEVG